MTKKKVSQNQEVGRGRKAVVCLVCQERKSKNLETCPKGENGAKCKFPEKPTPTDKPEEDFNLDKMLDKMNSIGGSGKLKETLDSYDNIMTTIKKLSGLDNARKLQSIIEKIGKGIAKES